MEYIKILLLFILSAVLFATYIDRMLLTNSGFKRIESFLTISFCLIFFSSLFFVKAIPQFLNILPASSLIIMLMYHFLSFLSVNIIFVFLVYSVLLLNYCLKKLFPKLNIDIISCKSLYHNTLLQDKKFTRIALAVSYFISTVLILFPVPSFVLSYFTYQSVEFLLISAEI